VLDGSHVVATLDSSRAAGEDRDALLEAAVKQIEASSDRYDWVGIYLLSEGFLSLHNYIGEHTDHTRIAVGHGVCGTAVAEDRDINVADVRELENYIACSIGTRAEIVVLIRDPQTNEVYGQLDLDSDQVGAFTDADEAELKVVADWLGGLLSGR
jgi:GAF domain-containing protein